MADFIPPWGQDGERRVPTSTEQQLGFPCGPLSLPLFNELFNLWEGQFNVIAGQAGVTSNENRDKTLLYRSVKALIDAALAGISEPPDYSLFVLMSQARARLPIYPEIQTADGKMVPTAPTTGEIVLPPDINFLHRGIFIVNTSNYSPTERTFLTDASKVYHLRWNPTGGFQLRDLSSSVYNPGSLPETNAIFDAKYDDMLVARVVTNSSNVATITPLVNLNHLKFHKVQGFGSGPFNSVSNYTTAWSFTLDWARTPTWNVSLHRISSDAAYATDYDHVIHANAGSRYLVNGSVDADFPEGQPRIGVIAIA